MKFIQFSPQDSQAIIDLFIQVFSSSENEEEGMLIGNLVSDLISTTAPESLIGFVAISGKNIIGSIFFSRLVVPSEQSAFILSPVGIVTNEQGKGIGQQLIRYGIDHLKAQNVDLLFTYGDPNFYSKVGFMPISENIVKAPFDLTYPEGWLAQSLDGSSIKVMDGVAQCVKALNDAKYW